MTAKCDKHADEAIHVIIIYSYDILFLLQNSFKQRLA